MVVFLAKYHIIDGFSTSKGLIVSNSDVPLLSWECDILVMSDDLMIFKCLHVQLEAVLCMLFFLP